MSRIVFNLAAKCDAAGRSQNQDNYWVCPDLTKWNAPVDKIVGTDEDVELSDKGALLVVADGMGGMNAGEVASKLVIEGVKKKFSNIPDSILTNESEIQKFIYDAIVESDELIKKFAKDHKDAEGLGSTIVLLWLLNGRAFCGWCGDSRIYRFNPNNELVRLSHDHSYVQSLVDEGKITEEEAFEHPDGNIISKALGDNGNKAEPELYTYDVYQRDVFMLCSDGLCGLLQDNEINDVISNDCTSSKETLKSLWEKGAQIGWSDNATIDVLCIVDGGKPAKGRPDGYPIVAKKSVREKDLNKPQIVSGGENVFAKILKPPYLYIIAIIAIALLGLALYNAFGGKGTEESSNHEFTIEVSESNSNNNDVNMEGSNSQSLDTPNANNQGKVNNGNIRGGRSDGQSNQSTGHSGTAANNGNNNQGNQNGQQQNGGTPNGNPINSGIIEHLNQSAPSTDFLNAYDKIKGKFGPANEALRRTNRQNLCITMNDEGAMRDYYQTYKNNFKFIDPKGKDYKVADEGKKTDVDNFERLYKDISNILEVWDEFIRQERLRQQEPESRYNGGVYLDT